MSADNRLDINVEEFRAALLKLPEELKQEGSVIVRAHTEAAYQEIDRVYAQHERSGTLQRRLIRTIEDTGTSGTIGTVKSQAPHAALFEFGSKNGIRYTRTGASRGEMPAQPTFVPIVARERRAMNLALVDLVKQAGLVVSGA